MRWGWLLTKTSPSGCGTFRSTPVSSNYGTGSASLGDLDGDGNPDLATVVTESGIVRTWWNQGDGTLAPRVLNEPLGTAPGGLALADLDGDGRTDMAVADRVDGILTVRLRRDHGTWSTSSYPIDAGAVSVVARDLNADGRPDLAVDTREDQTVCLLLNRGRGDFGPASCLGTGHAPGPFALEDVDGDRRPDLVTTGGGQYSGLLSVQPNLGDGTFTRKADFGRGGNLKDVATGDLDGDGFPDVVTTHRQAAFFNVMLNRGDGSLGDPAIYAATGAAGNPQPFGAAIGDLDADGVADVAITDINHGTLCLFHNDGSGTLAQVAEIPAGKTPSDVRIADLDGDPWPDMLMVDADGGKLTQYRGRGDGALPDWQAEHDAGNWPQSILVADVDRDGRTDVLVADGGSGSSGVRVFRNLGDGNLALPAVYKVGTFTDTVAASDMDGDGWPDLVVRPVSSSLGFLRNQGDGTFVTVPVTLPWITAADLAFADLDGDGHPELVAGGDGSVDVYPVPALGVPGTRRAYPTAGYVVSLAVADMDRDGRPDVVAGNWMSGSVSVLLNRCRDGL